MEWCCAFTSIRSVGVINTLHFVLGCVYFEFMEHSGNDQKISESWKKNVESIKVFNWNNTVTKCTTIILSMNLKSSNDAAHTLVTFSLVIQN